MQTNLKKKQFPGSQILNYMDLLNLSKQNLLQISNFFNIFIIVNYFISALFINEVQCKFGNKSFMINICLVLIACCWLFHLLLLTRNNVFICVYFGCFVIVFVYTIIVIQRTLRQELCRTKVATGITFMWQFKTWYFSTFKEINISHPNLAKIRFFDRINNFQNKDLRLLSHACNCLQILRYFQSVFKNETSNLSVQNILTTSYSASGKNAFTDICSQKHGLRLISCTAEAFNNSKHTPFNVQAHSAKN